MRFNLSKEDIAKTDTLFRHQEINMEAADIYNDFLIGAPHEVYSEAVSNIRLKEGLSEEKAYFASLLNVFELNPDDMDLKAVISQCHLDSVRKLSASDYEANPYYRNIKLSEGRVSQSKWKLGLSSYEPYECFIYDDTEVDDDNYFSEKTSLGYFPEAFGFLAVSQNDKVWMSITPHEIETMKKPIEKASGRVITFGLGLGYFAYMCSLKPDVSSITVIESDPDAISLFAERILPQFSYKEKIRIVRADAFAYLEKKMTPDAYDFAFVDLWHNPFDGIMPYLRFRKNRMTKEIPFFFWVEKSLLIVLRRCLVELLSEELDGRIDYEAKNPDSVDIIVCRLHELLAGTAVNSYDDIKKLLGDKSLQRLAEVIRQDKCD